MVEVTKENKDNNWLVNDKFENFEEILGQTRIEKEIKLNLEKSKYFVGI